MDRRLFLKLLGGAAAGGLLAGCGGAGQTAAPGDAPTSAGPTAPAFDPVAQVTDAEQSLSVLAATYEQIAGAEVPFAFGVRDIDAAPVEDPSLAVYVVPLDGEPAGPFAAESVADPLGGGGLYLSRLPFTEPGVVTVVAVAGDGTRAGSASVPVTTPDTSAFPAPTQSAPVVATPTAAEPLGAENLCTLDPPCGMHEISLDEALAQGRPVVLQFATPAYCQTAICGPSVSVLDEVRRSGEWADTAFIHCEIYADAGQNLLEPVSTWNLPTEPWMYTIDGDGQIVARTDGPLLALPEEVTRLVQTV